MSTTVDVAFAFDTHKFVKQMVATGFTEEQAEAQVRLLSEILHTQLSTKADVAQVDHNVLELKRDIEAVKAELKRDIETVRAELKRDIETVRAELKRDIETVRAELKQDIADTNARIAAVEANLKLDIATLDGKVETTKETLRKEIEAAKNETIRWMVGLALAQLAMMAGILMTLVRVLPGGH
ncbi:MAG: CCDC90 family protein [Magnetococcus sp. MYC-9]